MSVSDPFQVLGMPRVYDIDPQALRRAYLGKAARLHPDTMSGDEVEIEAATAELNLARATLENPEARAECLLRLLGGPAKEADRSLPDGFLGEIMEIRESLEEAASASDTQTRSRLLTWAREERERYSRACAGLFAQALAEPGPARDASLREIRRTLNAWRYIERMIEQAGASGSGRDGGS